MDKKPAVVEKEALKDTRITARAGAGAAGAASASKCWSPRRVSRRRPCGSARPVPTPGLHGLGQTKYIDDMYLPGMLYAKIKRAGVASARIIKHRHQRSRGHAGRRRGAHRPRHPVQHLRSVAQGPAGARRRRACSTPATASPRWPRSPSRLPPRRSRRFRSSTNRSSRCSIRCVSLQARDAGPARAQPEHLRPQGDQEGRRRQGVRRVVPASSKGSSAPRWSSTCRSSRIPRLPPGMRTAA